MKVHISVVSLDYPDLKQIMGELHELKNLYPDFDIEVEIRQMI